MARFTGKNVLITGGSTGIGLRTAQQFLSEGANVAITGQNASRLAEAKNQVADVLTIQADVRSLDELDNMVATVQEQFASLDILFVNAGIVDIAPLNLVDEDAFDNQMNVNFKGAFFTIQKALPIMNMGGSIIINTSIFDQLGMPGTSIYSASKAALRSLARTLTAELVEQKIRVNVVSPGPIETPIYSKMDMTEEELQSFAQSIVGNIPLGRFGTSEELANAVTFLASDDASFIHGQELVVDGGWTGK